MSQAIGIVSRLTKSFYFSGCVALLILSATSVETRAITVVSTETDFAEHAATTSAFFTLSPDGNVSFMPSPEGWAPKNPPSQASYVSSVTPTKNYSIVGNSTAVGNWTNGNGVPDGITLTFTAEMTVSALQTAIIPPTNTTNYLTLPGRGTTDSPVNSFYNRGIGITSFNDGPNDIDPTQGIDVSATTISNVSFTGTLSDHAYTFAPGSVSNFGTQALRSNFFNETTAGLLLTQDNDATYTIGFGQSTGTHGSNQIINNDYGTTSSIFPRQVGPYSLLVQQGTLVLKGLGLAYDVTYGITPAAVPVPGDYNHNGVVDEADYVLWRTGDPAADGNSDTVVDQADYDFWRARFGNTAGAGSDVVTGAAVPEPATVALVVVGLLAACSCRRSGRAS
ncbi:MAG TPA: PEP-CTERM sorting domain-containing protein [Lacipirellulaceae bacterium]|jgi:hypothetical protein|nr:PEP-CTERM sorting domain-containing protein [Lacipirellulaceae bacterium]